MSADEYEPDWEFAEGEGYVADVKTKGRHLRLFSALSMTTGGWGAYLYDMGARRWLVEREFADNRDDGKIKAEIFAAAEIGGELPAVEWRRSPSKQR